MSPEVLNRKAALMCRYLDDLGKYRGLDYEAFEKAHYTVERLLELLSVTASDVIFHLLVQRDEPAPSSYSAAFLRAGEIGLIDADLAGHLSRAAGMRNILVHGYETADQRLVYENIPNALDIFGKFVKRLERLIADEQRKTKTETQAEQNEKLDEEIRSN
ncbi:MAG: DUF86 domain-containing protein [Candidatus Edwardsbacteria bacterium]|nr:DUF86 domain-containing protein [Candidatus Edwardsbacteria bacterium]